MAKDKKEKKEKTLKEKSRGFIKRGIIYAVVLALTFTASFVFNYYGPLRNKLYYSYFMPETIEQGLEGEDPITFYHEEKTLPDQNEKLRTTSQYYYCEKNENGEEERVDISEGIYEKDGKTLLVYTFFAVPADRKVKNINNVFTAVYVVLGAIIVVYLFRLAYHLFLRSEEKKEEVKKLLLERQKKKSEEEDEKTNKGKKSKKK